MPPSRATLRAGSRAAATREPCQVRKEAALSDLRRVPRNGLVRAARDGGRGSVRSTEGARHFVTIDRIERGVDPELTAERRLRPERAAPGPVSALAGADVQPRSSARRPSSRRSATPSGPVRSPTRCCSSGRAGRARRRWPGSLPRRSTARTSRTATRAMPARPASRSARAGRSTSSRSTRRPTAARRHPRARASGSSTAPTDLRRKVYILDEAHQITKDAWNVAPQVARGAARLRRVHLRLDRPARTSRRRSSRGSSATTFRRLTSPRSRASSRRSSPPTAERPTRRRSASSPGRRPAGCATPSRFSTSSSSSAPVG